MSNTTKNESFQLGLIAGFKFYWLSHTELWNNLLGHVGAPTRLFYGYVVGSDKLIVYHQTRQLLNLNLQAWHIACNGM